MVERSVSARGAWASEDPGGPSDDVSEDVISGSLVPFDEGVLAHTDSAGATSWQESHISSFSVRGESEVFASLSPAPYEGEAVAGSGVSLQFTLPVEAPFVLQGSFAFDPTDADALSAFGSVVLIGAEPFVNKVVIPADPEEDWEFLFMGTAPANSLLILGVTVEVQFEKDPLLGLSHTGELTGSFEFTLQFGVGGGPNTSFDSDFDGLLDSWEEEGIDFDGDSQPEIDLPGMGVIVGTRDLLVEVDIMEGAAFDQTAIDAVVQAFSEAPAIQPNGEPGINLIVLVDTDQPAHAQLQQTANGDLPPEYYIIKSAFFGTEEDRNHPDWDQIRPVRLGIFRYCLWGETILKPNGRPFSGLAEGIPSNDFFVAGFVQSWFTDPVNATNGLAGTFMHELGHTIGLRHGGGPEDAPPFPNYKPNYFSVMNYSYQVPIERVTPQGTLAEEAWRLDFSRSATRPLDEGALLETAGLDGPAGRMMLFNSELPGNPSVINIGWAQADWVDWNNNSMPDPLAYERDISNISNDSLSIDVLNSYEDWDRLQIEPSGGMYFNDREPWPFAEQVIEQGIDEDSYTEIKNADWVDQTALGDLIFENGFELGSTTAWSETVP